MQHICVTGAAGMLGQHLVERLTQTSGDYTVTGIDLLPAEYQHDGYRHVVGDVRNAETVKAAVATADIIVHAAAALPSSKPADIVSTDVEGTRAVLEAARSCGVPRVVHISSTAVYGLPTTVPTPEDYPQTREDTYSGAKIAAEELCRQARGDGLTVAVLRPKTFLGPRRMGLFAMLFEWAEEGHHFPVLGRGDIRCQLLDVRDLVDATLLSMNRESSVVNTEFNLGADQFTTLREDFQAVLDAAGHGRRVLSVPVAPAVLALRGLSAAGLSPVYRRLIYKLRSDSYVSTHRAAQRLGWQPRYSNQATLLATFDWWREEMSNRGPRAAGLTHRDPWRQGALAAAKLLI
ncbi:NAD(P)-dependent oxidoreductase [Kineosporia mesophila]|uniref:NAD(P)-dependent oxidoreductase n=1 Tax=Kineosporia mesophila TaxID=566012 RepID=A0ABP6ZVD5_9ACTN|nr:NAD-dependent epimerase/dehydratase family protein [Kineosporia mesophila]MCD5355084.1 NAD-dependent epimerase/dehydratase family protein [Kineosporia mesophila]